MGGDKRQSYRYEDNLTISRHMLALIFRKKVSCDSIYKHYTYILQVCMFLQQEMYILLGVEWVVHTSYCLHTVQTTTIYVRRRCGPCVQCCATAFAHPSVIYIWTNGSHKSFYLFNTIICYNNRSWHRCICVQASVKPSIWLEVYATSLIYVHSYMLEAERYCWMKLWIISVQNFASISKAA